MRLISFSMTKTAFVDGSKTVTRRIGWASLKPGTKLMAVEKAMGLKPGERVVRLGALEVVSVRREPLSALRDEFLGTTLEGFPLLSPDQFIAHFCGAMKCKEDALVTRITFRRCLEDEPQVKSPPECEDCGDEAKRRTRCPRCRKLVCSWCWGHVHGNTGLARVAGVTGCGAPA